MYEGWWQLWIWRREKCFWVSLWKVLLQFRRIHRNLWINIQKSGRQIGERRGRTGGKFSFHLFLFSPLILLLLQGWVISHPTHQRNRRSPYSSFLNPKIVTHGRIEFTDVQKEGVETGEEKKCLEFWGVILKNKGSNSFLFLFSPFCC